MHEGILRGLIAVISLATFLGICWWAYRPQSRERFERDAMLVFDEDDGAIGQTVRNSERSGGARKGREASA